MSYSMLVRASRDGDQFHYLWAARRALQLLKQESGLVAITIEGVSTSELDTAGAVEEGEELIDIAEYFGSTVVEKATLIRYMQLKHSTLRVDQVWQPSGLRKTIEGFAKRYRALRLKLPNEELHDKLELWFVTNRTISTDFVEAIEDAANQRVSRHPNDHSKLKLFTSLDGEELASFCKMLRFEDRQDGYWAQRNFLSQDVSGYLPGSDVDAPTRLKELVATKALSESAANPTITKIDVLRALHTDEAALFPARCLVGRLPNAVPREQERELVNTIVSAGETPVLIHAESGVGKSVFSTRIGLGLPPYSVAVLYDCFGNGQYRSATGYRHRHRTALVQISNELSALGLCHPLIPTAHADASDYMRAFINRVSQSISTLRARSIDALLCIVVDAADNAQMAAEEISEPRSFIRDLLREALPAGVRVVALCRPHRAVMLNPPPNALSLPLKAFSRVETTEHLRQKFPAATEHDVDEFHRLSSHNPRVQALALSRKASLPEILRLLGPNPTTVESTIGAILAMSIEKLRDAAGAIESAQIDLICAGLAALRPLVPIPVLASVSGVDKAAITSFALDLGRPLIVNDDTIQFIDEPAESWFREKFRPTPAGIRGFVEKLAPLASTSAYVAAVLPQLMLEGGQFSELVELALTSRALPDINPVERRDVELQRLQFALKAGLRAQRYKDAAKLALKAGGESAGDHRQRHILQTNIDLAAVFISSSGIQELVSRRTFGAGWLGSHHAYEAALLSRHKEFIGDARSRLRMAEEWLRNWSKLAPEKRAKERISDEDRAVMAMAHFDIHGPKAAANSLRVWSPRELSYRAGRILARRFLDHGRSKDLDDLAVAATNDIGLVLAILVEAGRLHHSLPKAVVKRAFTLLSSRRIKIESTDVVGEPVLVGIAAVVEAAHRQGLCDASRGLDLLARYLPITPSHSVASRFGGWRAHYLRAYALRAAFSGTTLELIELAHPELRKEIEGKNQHSISRDLREFREDIGALLPWYRLWIRTFLSQVPISALDEEIDAAMKESAKVEAGSYNEQSFTSNEIVDLWIDVLVEIGGANKASIRKILDWSKGPKRRLLLPTLTRLAQLCAGIEGAEETAFEFSQIASSRLRAERSAAQELAEGFIEIARSILAISRPEAEAHFNQAVEVSSKIGDENLARWEALIDLAKRSAQSKRRSPEIAYKFARCAEVTRDYIDRDKHFAWESTVEALVALCPASSLSIISRWRDRRFGSDGRILPLAVEALVSSGSIGSLDVLPLIGFRADWDESRMIQSALACSEGVRKAAVLRYVYRYMSMDSQSVEKWRRLEAIAESIGVHLPDLKERIAIGEVKESAPRGAEEGETSASKTKEKGREWDEIFAGCDLATTQGFSAAYERFRKGEVPLYTEQFFHEATKRVVVGKEAEFVTAFWAVPEIGVYQLRSFLEEFPQGWKTRLAIRSALSTVLRDACRRFCMEIKRSRYYDVFPFGLACELSGLDQAELLDVVVAAIGESSELAGPDRLFSLVNLLSSKVTHDDAIDVLSYGLDIFNAVLEDADGDGPWTADLNPPAEVEDALAGYVWAGLASPVGATRWEAAHVVVGLCALGRTHVLRRLFGHAAANTTKPYGDRRFVFYSLHAHLWLLIASARAALEYGDALVAHADQLLKYATGGDPHVLIRLFAARATKSLDKRGLIELQIEVRQRLSSINESPYEVVARNPSQEYLPRMPGESDDELPENDRYFFGMDFGPYWLAPLGRCFGLSESEIERETLKSIRSDLGYSGRNRWDADERMRRRLYREEGIHHSHGSYPRVEDYGFYLSYHAMLITAGRLLAAKPLIRCASDWEEDRFAEWLARHDVSRVDGRWLSDRRDPRPVNQDSASEVDNRAEWIGSIAADDFWRSLFPSGDDLVVWGRWTTVGSDRVESIAIHTALVSKERSTSLLRALQTVDDPRSFRIPDAEDDLQFDRGQYHLKGWIVDRANERGVDNRDPWAGDVGFPAPEPAPFVLEMMALSTDADRRTWRCSKKQDPQLRSETWGCFLERDESEQPSGRRLLSSKCFVLELLESAQKDLIVEVEIERRYRYGRYESRDDDEFARVPSNRLFVLKSDRTIRAL